MKENLASEIITEQQKEVIDITELFKQLLTVVPYDTLTELEELWCKRDTSIGHSVMLFIKEEKERRKNNKV